jgi:hypothetical protein
MKSINYNRRPLIIIFSLFFWTSLTPRSPFRKQDPDKPEIRTSWSNSFNQIRHSNWVFRRYPLFETFNKSFFNAHLLPKTTILDKHDITKKYDCLLLDKLINGLVVEIKKYKKKYTHFRVIQDKNFNYKKKCGLLVLKFNDFPFVLKLFMETPKTLLDPYCKGFENQFFFYMSGGNNRHIAGLTRVKNLALIQEQLSQYSHWKDIIITPRKWYWIPKKPCCIRIVGKNIEKEKEIRTEIPGIYAIIADELDTKEELHTLTYQEKSELIMKLCMDLHLFVDPHADNFIVKYKPTSDTYTISIVDTEHFPSMVGLKEEPFFNNHIEWYLYLGAKFFQDAFLQTKDARLAYDCQHYNPLNITW